MTSGRAAAAPPAGSNPASRTCRRIPFTLSTNRARTPRGSSEASSGCSAAPCACAGCAATRARAVTASGATAATLRSSSRRLNMLVIDRSPLFRVSLRGRRRQFIDAAFERIVHTQRLRVRERQELHQDHPPNAAALIDPEVSIVDPAPAQAACRSLALLARGRNQEADAPLVAAVGDEREVAAPSGVRGLQRPHADAADLVLAHHTYAVGGQDP